MIATIRRFINQFFRKSRSINNKPLNALSLSVVIIIDIFILFNVFSGLDNISQWHLSPSQAYPCRSDWESYRDSKDQNNRDYKVLASAFERDPKQSQFQQIERDAEKDRLGKVSPICLNYAKLKDRVNIPENRKIQQNIRQKSDKVSSLEQANNNIRSQYDSTLLEKIAGQGSSQSINTVSAEKAKQVLAQNKVSISTLETEVSTLKESLAQKTESISLINLIKDDSKYQIINQEYDRASFWYPSIQLAFQAIFLLPLIAIALIVHRLALRKNAGLIALISFHLLAIFFIPLLLKIFEFLQIGAIFQFFLNIVTRLFGGLLFLVSYLYILLIPLVGFSIIKISQKLTPSSKSQVANRFKNQLCLNCAKKIRSHDTHCPHCGYAQYIECQNCHELTYKHLTHCKECGYLQDASPLLPSEFPPNTNR
ncbi:hypothetical protein [Chamaesiphon sp. VAR_48_metabat_135_sub]|uniref:hypothetical protein n=1 Tax=Chamaesiphon sp. VAR_48_metabat_135_sub TaxID=2964699 RepID=UPI00286B4DE4|nr:hypothetical protein [Chamaesiphon sp. VAR_48_metabat_135_sub]